MHDNDGKILEDRKYILKDVDPNLRVKKYSDSQYCEASVKNGARTVPRL